MTVRRVLLTMVAWTALAPTAVSAQTPYMLRGLVDAEAWDTDTNSNLLARNGGRPALVGRVMVWGAVEPVRRVVLYALAEAMQGTADEEYETEIEQAGVRYSRSRALVLDAGKILSPLGAFAPRRLSSRNPLIGEPDTYPVQYPLGASMSGALRMLDYRAAVVSLPLVHEEYTPDPSARWRPALQLGITPVVGVRVALGYTWGPYLNDSLTSSQLAGRSWTAYDQRIAVADVSVSVGYFELVAEASQSSYDVPSRTEAIEGYSYYVEGKYTITPRLFVASRLERNDYPFIRPVSPTFWVARKTDFHDEEFGIGFRLSATTLFKASYRQDTWHVDAGNAAFVRPGGRAIALQLSQEFDIAEWIDRARAKPR